MAVDVKFLKEIDSLIEVQQERNTLRSVEAEELKFSKCDRTVSTDYGGNYFVSFNLPYTESYFPTGCTLSKRYPELQQLNVDNIIIASIPYTKYSELIDGRTITMNVPQIGIGAYTAQTNMSAITVYSSTYTGDNILKFESSPLLGNNIAFLFSDAINKPYTGTSTSDIGETINHSAVTTWGYYSDGEDYNRRPSAISWKEVVLTYNTDRRTNPKYSVNVGSTYPDGRAGYNYDVPVGFISLDEGFAVLTHTAITTNFPWSSGYTANYTAVPAGTTNPALLKNIWFSGQIGTNLTPTGPEAGEDAAAIVFKDINTSFKITAVCLALPREFYISNNPTWDKESAIININEDSGFVSFDPLYVSELGLYNIENELIAIAKTSEQVEKDYTSVITFNVDIEF